MLRNRGIVFSSRSGVAIMRQTWGRCFLISPIRCFCFSQSTRTLAGGGGSPNASRTFNRFQPKKGSVSGTAARARTPSATTSHLASSSSTGHHRSSSSLTERLTASSYTQKKTFRPKLHPNEEVPVQANSELPKDKRSSNLTARSSLRGRFNRVAAERGFAFASLLYVIGECMTVSVTLFLHWGYLGQYADIRYWLGLILLGGGGGVAVAAGSSINATPEERTTPSEADSSNSGGSGNWFMDFLEMGPMLWDEADLRLSPRLLFHYGIANMMLWPLYRYQVAFCEMALPVLSSLRSYVVRNLRLDKFLSTKASGAATGASSTAEAASYNAAGRGSTYSKASSSSSITQK